MRTVAGLRQSEMTERRHHRTPERRHHGRWIVILTILLAGLPAAAAAPLPPPLADGGTATVAGVIDGDTVRLDDGRQVRLVGIQAPKLPLGRPEFEKWPLADAAKAALAGLIDGARVQLGYGGLRMDRHGRALAHLFRDDGLWVQGEMLRRGMARVYTFADNRAMIPAMLAREGVARDRLAGIWSHAFYAIFSAIEADAHVGDFAVVEGRVLAVDIVRGRVYLNFAADWRTDFTISIASEDHRRFVTDGIDVEVYEGRKIRVRGWLRSYNGPLIEVTRPEQIEILDE